MWFVAKITLRRFVAGSGRRPPHQTRKPPFSGLCRLWQLRTLDAWAWDRVVPAADITASRQLRGLCLLFHRDWECKGKRRTLAHDGLHPDFSPVHFDNPF